MSLFATLIHSFGSWFALRSDGDEDVSGPTTTEYSRYLQAAIKRDEMIIAEKSKDDERQIEARMGIYAPDVCFSDGRAGNWILAERDAVINVEDHQ